MKDKTQSLFYKVWNIIGILILLGIVISVIIVITYTVNTNNELETGLIVGDKRNIAEQLNVDLQHLMYDRPKKIAFSDYYLCEVIVLDKDLPKEVSRDIRSANDFSIYLIGAMVNIIFYNSDRSQVHKLLDEYAYISELSFPGGRWVNQNDSTQKFILYNISFDDNNGDGRINDYDNSSYYISDLSGMNLKQITPTELNLNSYWFSNNHEEIYFERIEEQEDKNILGQYLKTREVFFYNIQRNQFGKFDELQEIFNEIQNGFINTSSTVSN